MLNISHDMVSNDQAFLRQKAKENIQKYIDERLPEEYEKCLVGLNAITKEAWNTAQHTEATGQGIAHYLGQKRSDVGSIFSRKSSTTGKLAFLIIVGVFEYEADERGNSEGKIWEWK